MAFKCNLTYDMLGHIILSINTFYYAFLTNVFRSALQTYARAYLILCNVMPNAFVAKTAGIHSQIIFIIDMCF